MSSLALIINDRARRAGRSAIIDRAHAVLSQHFAVELLRPGNKSETEHVAGASARAGKDIVVVAGGDGTINGVAHALAGSNTPMGIIPLGTGNDLARELGVPFDVELALQRIVARTTRQVDLIRVNGHHFCTVGGLGLVSQCALAVPAMKERGRAVRSMIDLLGGNVYKLSAVVNIVGRLSVSRRYNIEFFRDDAVTRIDAELHGLFVANQQRLGAGLKLPSPSARDDGIVELLTITSGSRARLLLNLFRLSTERHVPESDMTLHHVTRVRITVDKPDVFFGDGDPIAAGTSFDIDVVPQALTVVC